MASRVFYNEIDEYCVGWIRNLIERGVIAPGTVDPRSILDLKPEELCEFTQVHLFAGIGVWSHALRIVGWSDDREIWSISCPCQPFSQAGEGEGLLDERHLWPKAFELVKSHRPLCIVGEQVGSQDALDWLDVVYPDLESQNYEVGIVDTCAAGFGAPHIRQRLYWFAHAGRLSDERRRECRETLGAFKRACDQTQQRKRRRTHAGDRVSTNRSSDAGSSGFDATRSGNSGRQTGEGGSHRPEPTGCNVSVRSDDAQREGLEGYTGDEHDWGQSGWIHQDQVRPAPTAGVLNGFWSDAIWLPCSDFTEDGKRKYRPTKPGLQPMAPRTPSLVGRLRAYGNALCAPQAIAFLECVKEILEEEEEEFTL